MNWRLTRKVEIAFFSALVIFSLVFVFSGFLEQPGIWFDEGITIEIARNFALFGTLDTLTAPGFFSGVPYLVGTNGYPLTVSLAGIFKIFGFGFIQARIFMLGWLLATLGILYLVTRRFFGVGGGLSATALAVSFASFYGNGLTATGEMPGLFFFLFGLWLLIEKKSYFLTGIVWGLAMAAKPGVFLLLAHTLFLYIIFADRERWLQKIFRAAAGFSIPIAIWILLVFPLTMGTVYSVVAYVLNPINIPVVTSFFERLPAQTLNDGLIIPETEDTERNVINNLILLATHSTTIYFFLLGTVVVVGLYLGRKKDLVYRELLWLIFIYGTLILFFFIRGPGWLRYLFGLQILLFIPLLPAVRECLTYFKSRILHATIPAYLGPFSIPIYILGAIFVFQTFHLYFLSNIPNSRGVMESIAYIRTIMELKPNATLGIYNVPEVAAFTDPHRTYHISLPQDGLSPLGTSPLLLENKPDIVIASRRRVLIGQTEEQILAMSYRPIGEGYSYYIYEKR